MDDIKILLENYKNFYKEFYGIRTNPTNAVNTVQKIESRIHTDNKILEYGCATGFNLFFLYRLGYKNLYGVDACGEYIKRAEKQNPSIKFKESNFSTKVDPFENERFDVIFCRATLQQGFVSRQNVFNTPTGVQKILEMFRKKIKDTGKIFISEGPVCNWPEIFINCGLKVIEVINVAGTNLYILEKSCDKN